MEAIRWEDSALYLLDQTRLPAAEDWLRYTDYRQVANAIQTMVVRGAPAIGITAAYAMVLAAQENACKGDFPAAMSRAKAVLAASRPTAVNLFWALDRMENLWLSAGPDLPRLPVSPIRGRWPGSDTLLQRLRQKAEIQAVQAV